MVEDTPSDGLRRNADSRSLGADHATAMWPGIRETILGADVRLFDSSHMPIMGIREVWGYYL